MPAHVPHLVRSDASDNRERIVASARALFAANGMAVPMREIARHAGVGPATLYRHFPTKEILATAAYADQVRECRAIVDTALADTDAWHGFRLMIERICALHTVSRGFASAFTTTYPDSADFAAERARSLKAVTELARRAGATGELRPDFTVDDLILMLAAHRNLPVPTHTRAAASRRFAALMIGAFHA